MKLSSETIGVLANFAKLNPGIEFKKGNVLKTISTGKTVLARTTLKDEFPEDFCVYDLPQFLLVYNLHKDTEMEFDEKNVIFKSGRSKVKYRKSQKDVIVMPPEKELTLPSVDVTFTLTQADFASILGAAAALQSPHIAVESEGDTIYLTAFSATDDSAHTNSIEVGAGNGTKFKSVFLTENLRLIPGTYDVEISSKGLSSFKNKNQDIQYWVAVEAKFSKFGE
jgi:hypothetical protein